jgi:hypothetical protein
MRYLLGSLHWQDQGYIGRQITLPSSKKQKLQRHRNERKFLSKREWHIHSIIFTSRGIALLHNLVLILAISREAECCVLYWNFFKYKLQIIMMCFILHDKLLYLIWYRSVRPSRKMRVIVNQLCPIQNLESRFSINLRYQVEMKSDQFQIVVFWVLTLSE